MNQNRLKSPVVWAAVVAQILAILVLVGVIGETLSDAIKVVVAGMLQVLTIFGVLNNPTDGESF